MRDRQPTAPSRPPLHFARLLLREYALAWAERALRGTVLHASAADDPVEVAFVDPFAGADHPLPPASLPVPVSVLARLFGPAGSGPSRVRALLLEEDPVKVDWLLEASASQGLGERAARPTEEEALPEIAAIEGGWEQGARAWTGLRGAPRALALVDPPGAGKLPLDRLVGLMEEVPALDLLLRFPVADLRRLAGFRGIPIADLPPYARRSADGIARLLGDPRHEWALGWRTRREEAGEPAAEAGVVDALARRLRGAADRGVRVFRVGPPEAEEFLLLSSSDPARILLMNEVLFEARRAGRLPWPEEEGEGEFVRFLPRAELELFGDPAPGAEAGGEPRDRVVDLPALAHALAERFAGRRVPFLRVLESVVESSLFAADVRRALAALRRDGRALYRSLARPDAEVAFPRRGAAGPHAGSRSSRRRADGEEELLLDLGTEGG